MNYGHIAELQPYYELWTYSRIMNYWVHVAELQPIHEVMNYELLGS